MILRQFICTIAMFLPTALLWSDIYVDVSDADAKVLELPMGKNKIHFLHFKEGYHTYCSLFRGAYMVTSIEQVVSTHIISGSALNNKNASDLGFDFYVQDKGQKAGAARVEMILESSKAQKIRMACQVYKTRQEKEDSTLLDVIDRFDALWKKEFSTDEGMKRCNRFAHMAELYSCEQLSSLNTQSNSMVQIYQEISDYLTVFMTLQRRLSNTCKHGKVGCKKCNGSFNVKILSATTKLKEKVQKILAKESIRIEEKAMIHRGCNYILEMIQMSNAIDTADKAVITEPIVSLLSTFNQSNL